MPIIEHCYIPAASTWQRGMSVKKKNNFSGVDPEDIEHLFSVIEDLEIEWESELEDEEI